jgi:nucleoside 2-deoxyribosyltransferase
MDQLLEGPTTTDQKERIRQLAQRAVEKLNAAPAGIDLVVLSMHLTYFANGMIIEPLSWHYTDRSTGEIEPIVLKYIIREFAPHYAVTLIEDIQVAHRKVLQANITLRDLLRWRNAETYTADTVANLAHFDGATPKKLLLPSDEMEILELYPYEFSPVIATRNDVRTFVRFLFQPEIPRVYSSFPISRPRQMKPADAVTGEINEHNSWLADRFTVFNPLAIDERPLVAAFARFLEEKGRKAVSLDERFDVTAKDHWQLDWSKTLAATPREKTTLYVKEVFDIAARLYEQPGVGSNNKTTRDNTRSARQMLRLLGDRYARLPGRSVGGKSELDHQIRERDFRMIDQSDCVVIYRPTMNSKNREYKSHWTGGTKEEYRYAIAAGKAVFIVKDDANDLTLDEEALGETVNLRRVVIGQNLNERANRLAIYDDLEEKIKEEVSDRLNERVRQTKHLLSVEPVAS